MISVVDKLQSYWQLTSYKGKHGTEDVPMKIDNSSRLLISLKNDTLPILTIYPHQQQLVGI